MSTTTEARSSSQQLLIKSVKAVDEKTVRAVVTAPTIDRDGDVIDTPSLRVPLKGGGFIYARELTGSEALDIPFLIDHDWSVDKCIGSARSGVINAAGELEVTFGMSSRALAQEMHTLLKEGHLDNAFSITINYDYGDVDSGTIYDGEVIEISLVFRGSNKDARLLEVSKSLHKETRMSETTEKLAKKEQLEKELAAINKEIEAEDAPAEPSKPSEPAAPEAPAEEPAAEEPKPDETPAEEPQAAEATPEAKPAPEPEAPADGEGQAKKAIKQTKQETPTMTEVESKAAASKAAAAKPSDVKPVETKKVVDENEHKILVVKQLKAMVNKDWSTVRQLNDQAYELDSADTKSKALKKKEITYSDGSVLYLAEQLDRDIEKCYGDYGNLGTLVSRVNLTQSPKYRKIVRDKGVDFSPVGFEDEKGEDAPEWSSFTLEPKPFAVIVAWSDHVAEDAYINVYNEIVTDIAEGRAKLEDSLVTTFATVTAADGTVFPDQGLTVTLDAGRTVDYSLTNEVAGSNFVGKLATAWGKIRGCDRGNVSMVMNGATWATIALAQDNEGRPLFTNMGSSIALGALGSVNVRTTDTLADGQILMGNFRRYFLSDKGGLELLASREATVGSLNLYTQDASALRAVLRLEGGHTSDDAFVVLNNATESPA